MKFESHRILYIGKILHEIPHFKTSWKRVSSICYNEPIEQLTVWSRGEYDDRKSVSYASECRPLPWYRLLVNFCICPSLADAALSLSCRSSFAWSRSKSSFIFRSEDDDSRLIRCQFSRKISLYSIKNVSLYYLYRFVVYKPNSSLISIILYYFHSDIFTFVSKALHTNFNITTNRNRLA